MTRQEFKQNLADWAWNMLEAIGYIALAIVIVLGALPHFGGAK